MTKLPSDPVLLLSYVNTQLRDFYTDLDDFFFFFQADKKELTKKLLSIGYSYNPSTNQFT